MKRCKNCNQEMLEHIPAMFEHPLLDEACSQECFEEFLKKIPHCKHTVRYRQYRYPSIEEENLKAKELGIPTYLEAIKQGIYPDREYLNLLGRNGIAMDFTYDQLSDELKKDADEKQAANPYYKCSESCPK